MGRRSLRPILCALAVVSAVACGGAAWASDPSAVRLTYADGQTELAKLDDGAKSFNNEDVALVHCPSEMRGLQFTRRPYGRGSAVALDVPAGATVYLMVGDGHRTVATRDAAVAAGWVADGKDEVHGSKSGWPVLFYKRKFKSDARLTLPGGGPTGVLVAAVSIELQKPDPDVAATIGGTPPIDAPSQTEAPPRTDTPLAENTPARAPVAGAAPAKRGARRDDPPATVALPQTSINALEVFEPENGLALGQTTEVVLTVTRGRGGGPIRVEFGTPVGKQMELARDEALRFVRLQYPSWDADRAEMTFEDKYTGHDGGSIGTAIGVLTLSAVQGFKIDPGVAITGDISANGKVRAIGQVGAKLRGAAAGHCAIAVIPVDNYDQLMDAVLYAGPSLVTDVQVIGAATLDDAVAAVRTDRAKQLTEATDKFSAIAAAIHKTPAILKKPETAATLDAVLTLAPEHLSAKVLYAIAKGTAPKTLSTTASLYYTFLAGRSMLSSLEDRAGAGAPPAVPSSVVRGGLADLRKLRPMADPAVRPVVDGWSRFIQSADEYQRRVGSRQAVERQRQALLDAMQKVQADPALMQKMLKEGM